MQHLANNGNRLFVGMACCLLLLSGCATSVSKESQIEERATARWDALLSGDMITAYEYLSPGYRSSVSLNQYQRSLLSRQLSWTNASYNGSECTEVSCKVKISLNYVVRGAIPGIKEFKGTQNVAESWVSVDRVWYLVPDK
jgi:hypothetical protein